MFVRWQYSKSVARWNGQKVNRCKAILVESVRIGGKPRQKYITFIASYEPHCPAWLQLVARKSFWNRAHDRLDRLSNVISKEDRSKIEEALALRVLPITVEENHQIEREDAASREGLKALSAAQGRDRP